MRVLDHFFSWLARLFRPTPKVLLYAGLVDAGRRATLLCLYVRWNDYRQGRTDLWVRIIERKPGAPRFSLHEQVAGPNGEILFCLGEEIPWSVDLAIELLDAQQHKIDAAGTAFVRVPGGLAVGPGQP